MQERKVLIRALDLKQYFPVKGGRFCKANDGISIDIYEGETFGLVGESGCGKSTLGRTLLQLCRQTSGRTIYYGQTLEQIAPRYVEKTLRRYTKERAKYRELLAKKEAAEKALEAAKNDAERFARQDALNHLEVETMVQYHALADVVGGFLGVENCETAIALFLEEYQACKKLRVLREKRAVLHARKLDMAYELDSAKREGWNTAGYQKRLDRIKARLAALEVDIKPIEESLRATREKIEALSAQYQNDPDFQRMKATRDGGVDLARLTYDEMRLLRSDLQMIFQDPYSSLNPRMTVGQIVGTGMKTHHLYIKENARMQDGVLGVMEKCGLQPYFLHRFPHQFSGGQRQRIGIARSLAVEPKFVVCDEAVSALDVSIQSQIINLLQDLKEQQSLTYLFITHDLSVVKYISDRIGVMYLGNMVELAPAQEIFDCPMHPYTKALISSIPTVDKREEELYVIHGDIPSPVNPPSGCKFHTRCEHCTEICRQVVPKWEEASPNHFVACHHMRELQERDERRKA